MSCDPVVHLPIVDPAAAPHAPTVRKSRSGRWRAAVLITIQLLLIGHVIHWLVAGSTLSPLEPSEGKDFGMYGVVNAGLIFFCLALLATLILGRWFCGWGCHIVMLQDFCGWLMKKCGVRPRLFRSRLLLWVPLLLALYMFLWPAAYRFGLVPLDAWLFATLGAEHWLVTSIRSTAEFLTIPLGHAPPPWELQAHLTTKDFWATFPGVLVAIPFLFICGFAAVYFLGSKGFCTYGCPYGGFFAPLDRYAVGRIRVTDACEHCGHCTAVCTSNVRVHEEVREYGMVVDPGCMKCMDCVSVCPNDALYFGFGRPAVKAGPAKNAPPKRHWDLTWMEEIACAAVFFGAFMALRGVYDSVPMLMAGGAAGIITYLAWKAWRIMRDDSTAFHHHRLKFKGVLQPAGWVFLISVAVVLGFTAHCGAVNALEYLAGRSGSAVNVPAAAIFSPSPMQLPDDMAEARDRAAQYARLASSFKEGGIALATTPGLLRMRASLAAAAHDFSEAERLLREIMDRGSPLPSDLRMMQGVLMMQEKPDEVYDAYTRAIGQQPHVPEFVDDLANLYAMDGLVDDAFRVCRAGLAANPDNLLLLRRLSLLELGTGNFEEAVRLIRQTIVMDDTNPAAYFFLGKSLETLGRLDEARTALERMVELAPQNAQAHAELASILEQLGQSALASHHRTIAEQLMQAPPVESPTSHQHSY